jgi:hypothetical protein
MKISAPTPTLTSRIQDNTEILSCACDTAGVWLCQPCGRGLRTGDTTYESIWRWRTRYTELLGGLGTGISEGNRSVNCGRGPLCLAAREVEQETDCDAEDAREIDSAASSYDGRYSSSPGRAYSTSPGSTAGSPGSVGSASIRGDGWLGPGYARHEIEGIGGRLKKKRVRMVKVGACVAEYEEERNHSRLLEREQQGALRSWCGWCWRVIPAAKEK